MQTFVDPSSLLLDPFLLLFLCTRLSVVISVDGLSGLGRPPAGEDPDVGSAKGGVAERVQDRVHRGVDVAEVVGEVPQHGGDVVVSSLLAQDGADDDQHAVGGPGHDEGQEDGAQRLGRLAVLLLFAGGLLGLGGSPDHPRQLWTPPGRRAAAATAGQSGRVGSGSRLLGEAGGSLVRRRRRPQQLLRHQLRVQRQPRYVLVTPVGSAGPPASVSPSPSSSSSSLLPERRRAGGALIGQPAVARAQVATAPLWPRGIGCGRAVLAAVVGGGSGRVDAVEAPDEREGARVAPRAAEGGGVHVLRQHLDGGYPPGGSLVEGVVVVMVGVVMAVVILEGRGRRRRRRLLQLLLLLQNFMFVLGGEADEDGVDALPVVAVVSVLVALVPTRGGGAVSGGGLGVARASSGGGRAVAAAAEEFRLLLLLLLLLVLVVVEVVRRLVVALQPVLDRGRVPESRPRRVGVPDGVEGGALGRLRLHGRLQAARGGVAALARPVVAGPDSAGGPADADAAVGSQAGRAQVVAAA